MSGAISRENTYVSKARKHESLVPLRDQGMLDRKMSGLDEKLARKIQQLELEERRAKVAAEDDIKQIVYEEINKPPRKRRTGVCDVTRIDHVCNNDEVTGPRPRHSTGDNAYSDRKYMYSSVIGESKMNRRRSSNENEGYTERSILFSAKRNSNSDQVSRSFSDGSTCTRLSDKPSRVSTGSASLSDRIKRFSTGSYNSVVSMDSLLGPESPSVGNVRQNQFAFDAAACPKRAPVRVNSDNSLLSRLNGGVRKRSDVTGSNGGRRMSLPAGQIHPTIPPLYLASNGKLQKRNSAERMYFPSTASTRPRKPPKRAPLSLEQLRHDTDYCDHLLRRASNMSNDSGFLGDGSEDDYESLRHCRYLRKPAHKTGDEDEC
ncbi:uncharacterized protein LOC135503201 [Lineus longissimus]|uniref:uncharacterized protein LOC135503201 n=1 Tax=Lineus longissimus TaxID=88925 RepID=UPI002B4C6B4F